MNTSNDIIRVIFGALPITDKRKFTRTCREYVAVLPVLMEQAAKNFYKMIRQTNYVSQCKINMKTLCKFTIELLFDGYAHLIPERYIIETNEMLYNYENIYFNSGRRKQVGVIELLMKCNKNYSKEIAKGLANGGHLKVLKWVRKKGCAWDSETFTMLR